MTVLPYVSGGIAGAICGLFGAGGGILLVPLLMRVHKLPAQKAFATSLAVILPVSAVTLALLLPRQVLPWRETLPYLLGSIPGGLCAGKWLRRMPVHWLRRLFGGLLLLSGLRAVLA